MKKELAERKKRAYFLNDEINYQYKYTKMPGCGVTIGIALAEIKKEKYYEDLGYNTFGEYVKIRCPFKNTSAYRYIRVATKLPVSILNRILSLPIDSNSHLVDLEEVFKKSGISIRPFLEIKKETIWQKICRKMKLCSA